MYDNCPFKNGNGYGDGRALSIGEVVIEGATDLYIEGTVSILYIEGTDFSKVSKVSKRCHRTALGNATERRQGGRVRGEWLWEWKCVDSW